MPHLVLEYSDNILEKNNLSDLFKQCHELLAKMLPTKIENCKSRAVLRNQFYLGNGQKENAFIHAHLKIMSGRSMETLQQVGESFITLFKTFFSESTKKLNFDISIEIQELQKTYFKS